MKRTWLMSCLASAIVSVIGVSPVAAQSSRLESGVSHQAAFDFYYETRLSPPVPPLKEVVETPGAHHVTQHVVHQAALRDRHFRLRDRPVPR